MAHEIQLHGKTYTSSKQAAIESGYTQDYIGQLARGGHIAAERVGGLWYVDLESLRSYKQNADDTRVETAPRPRFENDSVVSFDGRDYISASRASKISGYNQDYIGQLARKGALLSRQIGNRWYVDRASLLAHKEQKDKMLAAVQAESVGLVRTSAQDDVRLAGTPVRRLQPDLPLMTYTREDGRDLMPVLAPRAQETYARATAVPIRRVVQVHVPSEEAYVEGDEAPVRPSGKTIITAAKMTAAFTVVIMLAYGLVTLKDSARYADARPGGLAATQSALAMGAYDAIEAIGALLERVVTDELVYVRPPERK